MPKTFTTPTWPGGSIAVYLELGLPSPGSGVSVFDTAQFGTATFGPDATWTDISADWIDTPDTKRAVDRTTTQYTAGTATFWLDNSKWRYSEENPAGPFYGQIRSGIPIRARMVVTFPDGSVGNLPIFRGKVTEWTDDYPDVGRDAQLKITASDSYVALAKFNGLAQNPQGGGELSGARIHRILDNAGHTGPRNIDRGTVQLQPTTLASNALTELKLVADSEGGRLWVEADGTITFDDRYGLLENPKSNSPQITFDDIGTTGVLYSKPKTKSSQDLQRNTIAYARKGGTSQVVADLTARALDEAILQDTRTDLLNVDDPSVLALAQRDLSLKSAVERRFDGITIEPLVQPDADRITQVLKWLCQLTLWQQARVTRRPYAAGFTIDRYVFVTGIAHHLSPPRKWTVDLTFQSATVWRTFSTSLFDIGTFDSAVFAW